MSDYQNKRDYTDTRSQPWSEHVKSVWIKNLDGLPSEEPIIWAEKFGQHLSKGLSTSQLRKFFGKLKRIQAEEYSLNKKSDLMMLKPQLAYAKGRNKGNLKIADFEAQLSKAIAFVLEAKNDKEAHDYFKNFISITEAIVAYHKFYGGE